MIFVNFKTFEQGTGPKALTLAETCWQVSKETGVKIIPMVQEADIYRLSQAGLEVWTQHVSDITYGRNTGKSLPEAILAAGANGTLLNHSEHKVPLGKIGSILRRFQTSVDQRLQNFQFLVCAESLGEGKTIAEFQPDYLAYEPSELIGSQIESVSTAKPEAIREFAEMIKGIPIIVGAGIHCENDVKIALRLGAKGVLVSSDVVLAVDPKKELLDLAKGFAA